MAVIAVKIGSIQGECMIDKHVGEVDAVSLRESIEVAVPQSSSGGTGGVGRARHSDIELTRFKDKASPRLAEVCSAATGLGDVDIYLFRTVETGAVAYMTYRLSDVYVGRIEQETLDENGVAFQPHFSARRGGPLPPSASGLPSLVAPLLSAQNAAVRMAPRPMYSVQRGPASNREVERVWLNASAATWSYDVYVNGTLSGTISKSFDITGSKAI